MKFEKIINLKSVAAAAVLVLSSCSNAPNSPGYEFMPDMYRSPSLEYYSTHTLNGDTLLTAKKPVAGTIARGHMPGIPAGMDYEKSGLYLKNPIALSDAVMKDAEHLYTNFCVHCHGKDGKGDGAVGQKLPGAPPAYDGTLKSLSEGKIFYSITHGKGMMGAHDGQLNVEERWKLVHYVQKLQGPKAVADSAAAKATGPVDELKKEEKNK